ncbi:MAG: tetratricopeptide repeat protein, partial [Planctomycetota bacterium]
MKLSRRIQGLDRRPSEKTIRRNRSQMRRVRKSLAVVVLAGSVSMSTGCSTGGFSLASVNPFSRSAPSPLVGENSAPAIAGQQEKSPFQVVSHSTKSAFGKTTDAITGIFKRGEDATVAAAADAKAALPDPTSLSNGPTEVKPEVLVANGQMWESSGNPKKAMESYEKALKVDAKHVPAMTSMARLHFQEGNLDNAVKLFQTAIAVKPNEAMLHNDLGLTLSKQNNYPAAVASLERALQLAPGTSRYANNLASIRFEAGQEDAALQVLLQNNEPAVAHFNMAYLQFKKGNKTSAKQHLQAAIGQQGSGEASPATGRAIQRSREMLAQIDASMGIANPTKTAIAKTQPAVADPAVAKIASAAPAFQMPAVVQTASSTTPAPTLPASKPATAASAITPPPTPTAVATSKPESKPKWNSWNSETGASGQGPVERVAAKPDAPAAESVDSQPKPTDS